MDDSSTPDADALLHQAIVDSKADRHSAAIEKLQRALDLEPDNAKIHFLTGAEYAELGLFDLAIASLQRALALDPNQATARLHLGMIYFGRGELTVARETWQALDGSASNAALCAFKDSLLHFAEGDSRRALEIVEQGLLIGSSNPALLREMRRFRDFLNGSAGLGQDQDRGDANGTEGNPETTQRLLERYRQQS